MMIPPLIHYRLVLLIAAVMPLVIFLARKRLLNPGFATACLFVLAYLLISSVLLPLMPVEQFIRLHQREEKEP